jgi:hypothetical protein
MRCLQKSVAGFHRKPFPDSTTPHNIPEVMYHYPVHHKRLINIHLTKFKFLSNSHKIFSNNEKHPFQHHYSAFHELLRFQRQRSNRFE